MKNALLILGILFVCKANGQDPHFSQFYASPLTVSPAETLNTTADIRVKANIRQQWINPANPYFTGSFSLEKRILENNTGGNVLGLGLGFMHDNTFDGILKSTYASVNVAYHQILDEDMKQQFSVGLGATYGKRTLDFNRLVFASQFASGGFDLNLPTGESALTNMKGYVSLAAGISYAYTDETFHFDLGVSGYHLNNPQQTFLQDKNQAVPKRFVVHSSMDILNSGSNVVNVCVLYQQQANIKYYLFGGSYGFRLSDPSYSDTYLNLGMLYRWDDAVIPVISILLNQYQVGLSYDATISSLAKTKSRPNTFELTFSWLINKSEGALKCPYSAFK